MRRLLIAIGLLVSAPLAGQPIAVLDNMNAETRREFTAAYEAAASRTAAAVPTDSLALQAYVLYPYLQAARIEHAVARTSDSWSTLDERAQQFLSAHGAEPVARGVRRTWLASLGRRAQWQAFLDHYDAAAATVVLECQFFNARIARADVVGLAPAIIERWLSPHRLPGECEPAFQWLRAEGSLSDELIVQRATLLLDSGQTAFARVILRRLPADAAAPLLARAELIENPAGTIDAWLASPARNMDYDAILDGWTRLARNDPGAALERFVPLAARAPDAERASRLALALALGLAWDRRSEALEYFARVAPAQLDDYALEWLARAALWVGEWDRAGGAIAAMSPQKQVESAWRYWAARVADQRKDRALARELYTSLLANDNYYSAMAAAQLGDPLEPRTERLPLDADKVEEISNRSPFVRARELQLAGMRRLATVEWRHGYEALVAELQPQAIHVAAMWELYDVAVATATSHGVFNDYELLYPRPYANEVAAATALTEIDRALLYGVLRQESLFRADAASSAHALGVAQLQPATARGAARRWRLPAPNRTDLFNPAVNIMLGAARLTDLMEEFDGQLPVALAGYNAGENAARRWLPNRVIDSDIWIENIPYNETRAYVRRVMWHSLVFKWLETGCPQNSRPWLTKVSPQERVFRPERVAASTPLLPQ
ncbi:MAG: lytic transglycosylase domain-containing protein [Gammaproteobacteria bacterium]|nr:lytic transglycosylase domain-containing protein [Gammaproteobacteria bacterium]